MSYLKYTVLREVQYIMWGKREWGGGWLVLPRADWCTQARNSQSLKCGRLCGLEKGLCSTRYVGISDFKNSENLIHQKAPSYVASSSISGLGHSQTCVCMFFLHAKSQKAGWRAMWCHPHLSVEHGRAGARSCRAGGMSSETGGWHWLRTSLSYGGGGRSGFGFPVHYRRVIEGKNPAENTTKM